MELVPSCSSSARLIASLGSQLCFQKCSLPLWRQICPQMHCAQYDPLLLHGELYWGFPSLPLPEIFSRILCFWRNTCVMCYRMLNNPHYSCFLIKFLQFCHFQNPYFWTTTSTMSLKWREDFQVAYASCDFKACCLCRRKKQKLFLYTGQWEKYISRWQMPILQC